jgi:acetoin utilization protein AcuB
LTILNWMSFPVHTVKPRDSVAHARALLADYRINQLPVVRDDELVGIVTDRDLRDAPETLAISSQPIGTDTPAVLPDPAEIHIEDNMTATVVVLRPEDTVERAAQLMVNDRIGGIPIVEGKRLVGILTRTDVLQAFLSLSRPSNVGESRHQRARGTSRKVAHQESKPARHG